MVKDIGLGRAQLQNIHSQKRLFHFAEYIEPSVPTVKAAGSARHELVEDKLIQRRTVVFAMGLNRKPRNRVGVSTLRRDVLICFHHLPTESHGFDDPGPVGGGNAMTGNPAGSEVPSITTFDFCNESLLIQQALRPESSTRNSSTQTPDQDS